MTKATRTRSARVWPLAAIVASFCAGVFVDGWLRTYGPPQPAQPRTASVRHSDAAEATAVKKRETAAAMSAAPPSPPPRALAPAPSSRVNAPIATTGNVRGHLRVPIDGNDVESWKGGFAEHRGGGNRGHEAVDILSPRNTPVHAVEGGAIAKIFESKAGGHTVYQFSPDGRLIYYYAHLERYADGLHEGQPIAQGDVIGYVGTSGNAPPNTPHLHFAVFELGDDRRWWQGRAIDPYLVFKGDWGVGTRN
jgi:murein DD-endopeptidase MepM/ murein hydrolase activator NlpD